MRNKRQGGGCLGLFHVTTGVLTQRGGARVAGIAPVGVDPQPVPESAASAMESELTHKKADETPPVPEPSPAVRRPRPRV